MFRVKNVHYSSGKKALNTVQKNTKIHAKHLMEMCRV